MPLGSQAVDPNITASRRLDVFLYALNMAGEPGRIWMLSTLKELGFRTNSRQALPAEEIEAFIAHWTARRASCPMILTGS